VRKDVGRPVGSTPRLGVGEAEARGRDVGSSHREAAQGRAGEPDWRSGEYKSDKGVKQADLKAACVPEERAESFLAARQPLTFGGTVLIIGVPGFEVEVQRQPDLVGETAGDLRRQVARRPAAHEHVEVSGNVQGERPGGACREAADDPIEHADSVVHVGTIENEADWIRVDLDPPLDLAASLRPFGRWGDDGLDRWDGQTLARTIHPADEGQPIPYVAHVAGDLDHPALLVAVPKPARLQTDEIAALVRATFIAKPDALLRLAAADEPVRQLVERYRGIVPVLVPDPFAALVRSISAQQVNRRWAATIRRRLAEQYGTRHDIGETCVYSLNPERLAAATVEELRRIQLTNAKSRSLIAVAEAATRGELNASELATLDDEALISRLTQLPGIGRWSAEWFLARTLGRPRVVAGDLGVRKAVARLYGLAAMPSEQQVRDLTAHWGPAALFVQSLALHDLAVA
jgi:DNA-3-methyladenine glycosylase II